MKMKKITKSRTVLSYIITYVPLILFAFLVIFLIYGIGGGWPVGGGVIGKESYSTAGDEISVWCNYHNGHIVEKKVIGAIYKGNEKLSEEEMLKIPALSTIYSNISYKGKKTENYRDIICAVVISDCVCREARGIFPGLKTALCIPIESKYSIKLCSF